MNGLSISLRRFVFNNRQKNVGRYVHKEFPKFPLDEFSALADRKLLSVHFALTKLKEADPVRVQHVGLSSLNNTVTAEIAGLGTYKLSKDEPECFLYLFSPHTGNFNYYYNQEENMWVNTKDEHVLDEYLVRELLKFTQGYLDL
jgi:frataxin-like iron-binding protein CyaY